MSGWLFEELPLEGAFLITPFVATDTRGSFIKDYSLPLFRSYGMDYRLNEVFYTVSKKGVIRALHFQENNHQPKLVRCLCGRIFDIIVDLRPASPTFKQWFAQYLDADHPKCVLVPEHFGHGYLVLEEAIVSYKCAVAFDAENDSGIRFDDPTLALPWPLDEIGGKQNLIISDKDNSLPSFEDYLHRGCP